MLFHQWQTCKRVSSTHSASRTALRQWRTWSRRAPGWSTAGPCWTGRRWDACSTCTWRWRPWWRSCRRRGSRTSRPGTSACSLLLRSTWGEEFELHIRLRIIWFLPVFYVHVTNVPFYTSVQTTNIKKRFTASTLYKNGAKIYDPFTLERGPAVNHDVSAHHHSISGLKPKSSLKCALSKHQRERTTSNDRKYLFKV